MIDDLLIDERFDGSNKINLLELLLRGELMIDIIYDRTNIKTENVIRCKELISDNGFKLHKSPLIFLFEPEDFGIETINDIIYYLKKENSRWTGNNIYFHIKDKYKYIEKYDTNIHYNTSIILSHWSQLRFVLIKKWGIKKMKILLISYSITLTSN